MGGALILLIVCLAAQAVQAGCSNYLVFQDSTACTGPVANMYPFTSDCYGTNVTFSGMAFLSLFARTPQSSCSADVIFVADTHCGNSFGRDLSIGINQCVEGPFKVYSNVFTYACNCALSCTVSTSTCQVKEEL